MKKFYLFIDETGDHNLSGNSISADDKFGLGAVLCSKEDYINVITKNVSDFKKKYWKEGLWKDRPVILHSYDIRHRKGAFGFLNDVSQKEREKFYTDLSNLIESLPITVFGVVIQKRDLRNKYEDKLNPYNVSLDFILERVFYLFNSVNGLGVKIIAESRGKREDYDLQIHYQNFRNSGTYYLKKEIDKIQRFYYKDKIEFIEKKKNKEGLQIADLCVFQFRELADYLNGKISVLSIPSTIVKKKLHKSKYGKIIGYGLKIFPPRTK